jgi:transcription factor Dp-1
VDTIGYSNTSKVADELIKEFDPVPETKVDQKNVRRRVYDALNVFMALGIIHKDKYVC